MKVLLMVVVPLLTSGVLPKLLAMIGIRLPHGVLSALGAGGAGAGARGGIEGAAGGGGVAESFTSLVNLAKMFA